MKRLNFFMFMTLFASVNIMAQTHISGKVVNEKGDPVDGANIRLGQTLIGCKTDATGHFSLKNIPEGKQQLRISHVGFKSSQINITQSQEDILVRLENAPILVDQVVVTGTGTHRRQQDAAVPTTVITAKQIQESGIVNLEDALNKLNPSFNFYTNGMGTVMSMNGLTDEYVLVLLNGKRIPGDGTGGMDLTMIDITNVKRIEIVNGASSALYGTDAIAGVVNIITDDPNRGITATENFNIRSKGRLSESVNLDINTGKLSSYTNYQRQQANDWQLSPYRENSKTGELEPTDYVASYKYHSDVVSEKLNYAFSSRLSVYAQGSYFNTQNERPATIYNYDMRHLNTNWGVGAKYLINKKVYVYADYSSDYYKSQNVYNADVKKSDIKAGDHITRRSMLYNVASLKGVFNIDEHHKLSAGTEYTHENLAAYTFEGKKTRYNWALYAQDEISFLNHFNAIAGLRYTYNENFDSEITPNVALMYTPARGLRFRASYAMGYRAPNLNEMYASSISTQTDRITLANPDLSPERSHYFSFNAEYANSWLTVSATAYMNRIHNLINYEILDISEEESMELYGHISAQRYINTSKARVTGITLNANIKLPLGFAINAGYTYTDGKDLSDGENYGNRLDKNVYNILKVGASYAHKWKNYRLNATINGRYQDGHYSQSYQQTFPAPNFQLWDIMTTHSINLKPITLEPGIGIENVFNWTDNRPWNNNYATLNPGRSILFSMIIKFKN